ncbi:MAG: DUF134 domain-containing protein [Thermacetogeniaceae bacterium]
MPRRRKRCWVEALPTVSYFQPAGFPVGEMEEVRLSVEELEAVRLKDLVGLDQEQCAERMGIGRTTFQRILYAARSKIADALVNGKVLRVEGGEYQVPPLRVFKCDSCGCEYEFPLKAGEETQNIACPRCKREPLERGGGMRHCWRRGWGHGRPEPVNGEPGEEPPE